MSPALQNIVKKLVVLATAAGLGSAIAFMLVACGGESSLSSARPRAASAWRALPAAPIKVDAGLTSAWTGKELIVSGVRAGADGTFVDSTDVAAAYIPATGSWRRLAKPPKMDNYCRRAAAWTGREMLVWGCGQVAYDPLTDGWRRLPQAPTGQGTVAWTGRELIGWGGGCCGDAWSGGSAYDPAANEWRTLADSPLAPEQRPVGAWTGHELVLFVSGINPVGDKPWPARYARAAAYDPTTDSWRLIAPSPAAGLRFDGAAAWDGHEVLLVGAGAQARTALAYNPAANRWRRLAPLPAGFPNAAASWTGHRLLVWSGAESARALAYDPQTDRWSTLPRPPLKGWGQIVAWTGRQLIVWSSVGGAALTPALG